MENINEVIKDIPNSYVVLQQNTHFNLQDRIVHGYEEADRVGKFVETCNAHAKQESDEERAMFEKKLGELMTLSHNSCKDLYECSSPELDELVGRALKAGALGSRLTGAGWGGCCVSVVPKTKVADFITEVMKYYTDPREHPLWVSDNLNMYIFATNPGRGALTLIPDYTLWF